MAPSRHHVVIRGPQLREAGQRLALELEQRYMDLDGRLDRLEARMDRLSEKLDAMGQILARAALRAQDDRTHVELDRLTGTP